MFSIPPQMNLTHWDGSLRGLTKPSLSGNKQGTSCLVNVRAVATLACGLLSASTQDEKRRTTGGAETDPDTFSGRYLMAATIEMCMRVALDAAAGAAVEDRVDQRLEEYDIGLLKKLKFRKPE